MSTVGSKKGGNMVATVHTIPMGIDHVYIVKDRGTFFSRSYPRSGSESKLKDHLLLHRQKVKEGE
jgi:hypothetical protein